jgi:hypothetical protein
MLKFRVKAAAFDVTKRAQSSVKTGSKISNYCSGRYTIFAKFQKSCIFAVLKDAHDQILKSGFILS